MTLYNALFNPDLYNLYTIKTAGRRSWSFHTM